MGYSMTWVAVRTSTPQAVRDALALRDTGGRQDYPESGIAGAVLPGGWYLVASNEPECDLTGKAVLERLSMASEVIACLLEEHVMVSSGALWRDGREVWSIHHDSQRGIEHLEVSGELPPNFVSIRDRQYGRQKADGGRKANVDHIIDIPVALAHEITGWRPDYDCPSLGEITFELLSPTGGTDALMPSAPALQPLPVRPWWRRFLGF